MGGKSPTSGSIGKAVGGVLGSAGANATGMNEDLGRKGPELNANDAENIGNAILPGYGGVIGASLPELGNATRDLFKTPDSPTLKSPSATSKAPTRAASSTTAIQNQLARESTTYATSSYLTGGQGLLEEEPTTTSQILIGS